jgi:molybdopterin synthase catalytic subunit
MKTFSISQMPIDSQNLQSQMRDVRAGAFICFEGWVRNHHQNRDVLGLQYQTYAALAEAEGEKIIHEALQQFEVIDVRCVHRVGSLAIGDCAVWVGVSAAHRDSAFAACRYVIDEVKQRVAIWKKEQYRDGSADWLHPTL